MGSGTTNFLSTIELRTLGTADFDKLTTRIDAQTAALLGLGKGADKVNEHPGFNAFAEKIKQGIQDPLGAAGNMAEGFLTKLGPVGVGVAGIAATMVAAGVASVSFMRQLGSLGEGIEATGVRMGLSNRQVQDFSFAMKYAGGDISSLEGTMRLLSKEIDGGGSHLRNMGIEFQDFATGKTRPISDILIQLSERWRGMTDTIKRNAEATAVMGRGALGVLPQLMELSEGLGKLNGRVLSDGDLGGFKEMRHQVALIDRDWDFLITKLKQGVVIPFSWMFPSEDTKAPKGKFGSANFPLGFIDGPRGEMSPEFRAKYDAAMAAKAEAAKPTAEQLLSIGRNDAAIAAAQLGDTGNQLASAKRKLADDLASLKVGMLPEVNKATFEAIAADRAQVASLEAREAATKKLAETIKGLIAEVEKQTKTENDYTTKLVTGGRQLYLNANPIPVPQQPGEELMLMAWTRQQQTRRYSGTTDEEFSAMWNDQQLHSGQRDLKDARDNERRGMGLYGVQASLGGVSEIDQINTAAALRKQYADQEFAAQEKIANAKLMLAKNEQQASEASQLYEDALEAKQQKRFDAEIERQQALLQMALRQKQEFQNLAVGLFDSILHGGTSGFLKQQGEHLLDQAVGRAAGLAWGDPTKGTGISAQLSKVIPKGGPLDKLFGLGVGTGADPSMKLMAAGSELSTAAADLINAARALAMSRSGGGGGPFGGFGGFGGFTRASSGSGGEGGGGDSTAGMTQLPSGLWSRGPVDSSGGYTPANWGSGEGGGETYGLPTDGQSSGGNSGEGGGGSKAVGYGMAGIGAGLGIYGAVTSPSTKGKLASGGGSLMAVGAMVPGPVGLGLMVAGAAVEVASMFLGDPKADRAKDLATEQQSRSYTMPSGADYSMDASGRYSDYNYQGKNRQVSVTYNVYAMDSTSFRDFLIANPNALSSGITSAIAGGNADDVVGSLSRNLGLSG